MFYTVKILTQTLIQIIVHTTQKMTADLVTFTEEILNGKLHFLCSVK